jgi:hypothetical protein
MTPKSPLKLDTSQPAIDGTSPGAMSAGMITGSELSAFSALSRGVPVLSVILGKLAGECSRKKLRLNPSQPWT